MTILFLEKCQQSLIAIISLNKFKLNKNTSQKGLFWKAKNIIKIIFYYCTYLED